jgi:RNA polymerase sigma-70 factor (ECF subfamily)
MPDAETFTRLMARLRTGEDAAAREVFERFAGRLAAMARGRFNRLLARKVDPEDVVQSAFRSFFTRHDAGQLDLTTWDELWSLLTVITVRKCANQAARFRAQRRDVAGEIAPAAQAEAWGAVHEVISREPTASQAAMLTETVEQLMRALKSEDRVIITLSLQGYSVAEISARLGFAERTVRRLREHVKHRLLRMQADEP